LMRIEGGKAYRRSRRRQLRQGPPPTITVECSRWALLQMAGVPLNDKSRSQIEASLKRLCGPVGKFPPILHTLEVLPQRKLPLTGAGHWLDLRAKGYARIPLPLQLSTTTALAMYLFLNCIRTIGMHAKGSIKKSRLYERLGMATSRHQGRKQIALDKAVA